MQGTKVVWQLLAKLTASESQPDGYLEKQSKFSPEMLQRFRDDGLMQVLFPKNEAVKPAVQHNTRVNNAKASSNYFIHTQNAGV